MNRNWLSHRLTHYVVLCGTGAGLIGLAMVFGMGAADAQQNAVPNSGKRAAPPPANATQAPAAVPRHEAKAEHREAKRNRRRAITLGAQLQAQGNQGLQVSGLEENSIAARAGLQQNDRILSVDGRSFTSGRQLDAYLASQGGRRVPLVIDRNGQRLTILVTPAPLTGDTAWLGVFLEEGEATVKGARITHVYPSGPAARAGLQAGDIITQIDNQKIESPADVITLVQESEPLAEMQFLVLRNDQEMKFPVALGSRGHFLPPSSPNGYSPPGNGNEGAAGYEHSADDPDDFEDIPPHAMQLERDRRVAEQHQRIETELRALREEIRQLREELKKK